jgi:hypothetical protein
VTITVTLGRPAELTHEEKQQRIRRAAEALEGCGWLFDEHISYLTQMMLDSSGNTECARDAREHYHLSIRAAAELKARLVQIVNSKPLLDKQNGRS